ncbi:DEAD/DEAH box helicase domain-containing protein [Anoxybacillus tepidamans]|uniref:DEAD/DEAH box helicase domain-containing protein n=1 Tax=Anoxybacteroides tepidamans TaxID=265948 RepID=A0A7W8IM81_9BACL|nr:DEAD/DEAH box helicase [Anoxybacillus tepidamans]MBB5323065.1 DEAD/DEAH box helicase domain-containing protein [Anoxybacillus tepidamans]
MKKRKTLPEIVEEWKKNEHVVHWHTIPEREAKTVPFPESLHPRLKHALQKRGISSLYTHQKEAYEAVEAGKNVVAVTPTASGKTLCYNLPVLQTMLHRPEARALYLFPTKALAQDQKSALNEIIGEMETMIYCDTYDGDTSPTIRQKIRKAGNIVITNPDMLHSGILPHHTKWVALFENLQFVVIDELHTYRGVFGSHVANVIRRLKRICRFYGSEPQFICTSATIANPKELAETLTGNKMVLIDRNGAPSGKKHFVFYNPPVVNRALNIRKSATLEVKKLASELLKHHIQTIVFAKSRVRVEILLSYLKQLVKYELGETSIRAYRGGYLPSERRAIEKGLRNGEIRGVVSTNALELGVDIGQLQACIITGYPGTIASTWQQAGRAGRRQEESIVVIVASSSPLDQYIIQHPSYFLERSPETARLNPDNLVILVDHMKCAAFELPFRQGETFDGVDVEEILEFLTDERVLYRKGEKWYWMSDSFPAHTISLRSASQENVVIIDISETGAHRVIGEMDRFSAMTLLHEEAIYLHQGVQYQVEKLDWEEKKAYVRQVDVEYFTDANLAVELKVLEEDRKRETTAAEIGFGDVMVLAKATIFKKIKLETHENIGSGPIYLPEEELHTNATWISLKRESLNHWNDERIEQGLLGVAHILQCVAPLFVMCDPSDLHVVAQVKAVHNEQPTIFFYDRYPGGIGLSDALYHVMEQVLEEAKQIIERCPCESGCPSCIGTDVGTYHAKSDALRLMGMFTDGRIEQDDN